MLRHKVHKVSLPNGVEGLVIDTPKTGVVTAEFSFRAGEFLLDTKKWETAHMLEHVLLGANKDFPRARDFQAAIEQNGAYSNASTSVYDVTYEFEAADFEWQRVLKLLLDALSTPKFLDEEFASELSNVREELISRSNSHFRHLNITMRKEMGLCALTDPERVDLLDDLKREDLLEHYKNTHTLTNCRFIISGHFAGEYSEIEDLITHHLKINKGRGRIEMPHEVPVRPEEPIVIRKPSVPNIYLILDMYAPRIFSEKEYWSLNLLSNMLTETMYSTIFGVAREKGWVYGMGSSTTRVGSASGWWIGAQVSKTNSEPLMRLIRDECIRVRDGDIEESDFEAARKNLLGKTMRSGQTSSGIVSQYSAYYATNEPANVNRQVSMIESITKENVRKIMHEMCEANLWGLGVLGSTSLVPARKLHAYAAEIFKDC